MRPNMVWYAGKTLVNLGKRIRENPKHLNATYIAGYLTGAKHVYQGKPNKP